MDSRAQKSTKNSPSRSTYNRGRYRNSKAKIQNADENELKNLFLPHDMLNLSDTGDIAIGGGRVSLSDNENQWIAGRNDTTRRTNGDSKNNTDEFANMGDNNSHGQEWEFLTPPSWDNSQYGLGNHYEEWGQKREIQSSQTREEMSQDFNSNFRKNTGNNTKLEQTLTTTQKQQTQTLQHQTIETQNIKNELNSLHNQCKSQSEELQNLSRAYSKLEPILNALRNILEKK